MNSFLLLLAVFAGWILIAFLAQSFLRWLRTSQGATGTGPTIRQKLVPFVVFQIILFGTCFWGAVPSGILFGFLLILGVVEFLSVKSSGPGYFQKRILYFVVLMPLLTLSFFLLEMLRLRLPDALFLPKVFLVIALFDSFSQITGQTLGGPKIVPQISPNKTWLGLAGGFFFATLGVVVFWILPGLGSLVPQASLLTESILLSALCLASFLGDVAFSFCKRRLGIKDFSNWMGASGGILDRVDSFLFTGPVLWLFFAPTGNS